MLSARAVEDWEDLRAAGLNPTLADFDRLNQLALKLTDGPETTGANAPRVGFAGDIPFYEPTLQSLEWSARYASRLDLADDGTDETLWAFALAHARQPGFFAALTDPGAIETAVREWAEKLPVTREEVRRACNYAACGYSDAVAADNPNQPPRPVWQRASADIAAESLQRMEAVLVKAMATIGISAADAALETPSRLDAAYERFCAEQGHELKLDEARLLGGYKFTLSEIRERLTAERAERAAAAILGAGKEA